MNVKISTAFFSYVNRLCVSAVLITFLTGCSDFFNSNSNKLKIENSTPTTLGDTNIFDKLSEGDLSNEKVLAHYFADVVSPEFETLKNRSQLFELQINELCKTAEWESSQLKLSQQVFGQMLSAFRTVEPLALPESIIQKENWPVAFFDSANFFACSADLKYLEAKSEVQGVTTTPETNWPGGLFKYAEYYLFTVANKQSCDLEEHPAMKDMYEKHSFTQPRCQSLKVLSRLMVEKSESLNRQLKVTSPEVQKYVSQLQSEKKLLLSPLIDSLFFLEILKDAKLGKPIGLSKDCLSSTRKCPQSIEENLSKLSYESFEAILKTLKSVFFGIKGSEKYSIANTLITTGHADIASHVKLTLQLATDSIQSLKKGPSFEKAIEAMDVKACARSAATAPEVEICGLFQILKELSTILRSEVIQVLSVGVPVQHQGDSD